jgi:hypothetical protein
MPRLNGEYPELENTAMETPVIREEVQAYLQACITFAEFSRFNELPTAEEREAIDNVMKTIQD